jgi:hypothetical protein
MAKKKVEPRKVTLENAVSEAFSELQSLAEEMREAFDNTPESLQRSGVGEAREAAADALEQIEKIEVPKPLKEIEIELLDLHQGGGKRGLSRPKRRDNAVNIIENVISLLDDIHGDEKKSEDIRDAANELRDSLENAKDSAEGVEFPGMYG